MFVAYETKKRKIGYKNDELKISAPRQNEKKRKILIVKWFVVFITKYLQIFPINNKKSWDSNQDLSNWKWKKVPFMPKIFYSLSFLTPEK